MLPDNFAVFILSHGRADNVITYKTFRKSNYTGKVYIVIDNEDKQAEKYYQNFGDMVIVFDKAAEAERTDTGDNFPERNTVLFARNAVFDIAERLGLEYFLVLDDDYKDFRYKIRDDLSYNGGEHIKSADLVIEYLLSYYKSACFASLAIAQGGDFIGGAENNFFETDRRRKAMNFWILSTKRRFDYVSRMNDDVSTYVKNGNTGKLFFTFPFICIEQLQTQSNDGGLTDMYKAFGTYVKSFYTVMYQPSSVVVKMMPNYNNRLHHSVNWDYTVPAILSEEWRKP